MEQKVDPDRILGLADGMKRLNRVIEEGVMEKCADVSRLVNETKNEYREFAYVRSAASEVDDLLQEIKKLARSISEELHKKEAALSWTAREYKRKDAEAVKLLEIMKKRVPVPLNRFSPSSFAQNSNFQSLFTSLPSTEAKLTNSTEPLLKEVSLTPDKNQPQLIASDPYNTVSLDDILNRDDPDVKQKLQNTYWGKLSVEEQDRRYKKIKAEMDGINKKLADENRRVQSGIGNQFFANLFVGGSNLIVNAINTATLGAPETITEWITGPAPEGYVNPIDDPYGKMAGKLTGEVVGFMLPFKYLKALKSPALLGKLSSTVLRSVTAEAIFSSASQVSDALTDYKQDGDQNLGERLGRVAMNTALAGAGDVAFTFIAKPLSVVISKGVTLSISQAKVTAKKFSELLEKMKLKSLVEETSEVVTKGKVKTKFATSQLGSSFEESLDSVLKKHE